METPKLIEEYYNHHFKKRFGKYQCPFCPKIFNARIADMNYGRIKSCGCYKKKKTIEKNTRHNMSDTPIHRIWSTMKSRCNNPNHEHYKHYGGRGIKVCDRWLDFNNFYADMGDPPFEGATLDRINNDGDYCPENCRWATRKEQATNKRDRSDAVYLTHDGKTQTQAAWAKELGISPATIQSRRKKGWSDYDALFGR